MIQDVIMSYNSLFPLGQWSGKRSGKLFCWSQLLNFTHTLRYWSDHGVSMECWKICLIFCFWSIYIYIYIYIYSNIYIYSKVFWIHSCRISLLITYFKQKLFQLVILLQALIFFCFIIHSKGNLSLRGVTWNSHNSGSNMEQPQLAN